MVILIPAYEPDERLVALIQKIKKLCSFRIVIVDDGSGARYQSVFAAAKNEGCMVLRHSHNLGKGQALKTGFSYIKEHIETAGVICADCDGQHRPEDILKISKAIRKGYKHFVLGRRKFVGGVPLRSRFGNAATRLVFSFATGLSIYDTQTGLRGYPYESLKWLCSIGGQRFEYEMNILLEAKEAGYQIDEIDIDTVYYNGNKSSHFRTVTDSFKVWLPIIKFSASSLCSGLLDFLLVVLIQFITDNLFLAVAGARVCSSIFNYSINRSYVFEQGKSISGRVTAQKYFMLVVVVMLINYGLNVIFFNLLGLPIIISKLLAEATIFLFSFWSQRKFVFTH